MANNLNQIENKEKLFSPINGSYSQMFLTFIYFVLLVVAIIFFQDHTYTTFSGFVIPEKIQNIVKPILYLFYTFTDIKEFWKNVFFFIILPLIFTFVIHKSFIRGLSILIAYITFIIFLNYFIFKYSESLGYFMLFIIAISPIIVIISLLSILARGFFRIKHKWVRILILIIPFMIIIILMKTTKIFLI